jgi:hypothetical protein
MYILYVYFGKEGGVGEIREKVEGATVHKRGRKIPT